MILMGKTANEKEWKRFQLRSRVILPPTRRRVTSRCSLKPVIRWVGTLILVVTAQTLVAGSTATAQPPLRSPFSGESLRQSKITLTVQNQALGDVLSRILESVNLAYQGSQGNSEGEPTETSERERPWSLWLDRRVDPSQTVDVTATATPATEVINRVIEPVGLVAYPLPGVLLVGRNAWVESTLASLPTPLDPLSRPGPKAASRQDLISIVWPTGTTAAEVLSMAVLAPKPLSSDPDKTPNWLPHDVWSGGSLTRVDRTIASALILAQFDLRLQRTGSLLPLLAKRSSATGSIGEDGVHAIATPALERSTMVLPQMVTHWRDESTNQATNTSLAAIEFNQSYPSGEAAMPIRQALQAQKIRASVRGSKGALNIRTTAHNHLIALKTLWSVTPESLSRPNGAETEAVFDLKLVNKSVGEVLSQFAAAAGKPIRFEPGTELASRRLVSLDAIKQTLHQLADEVAGQVGLVVKWEDEEVIVVRP